MPVSSMTDPKRTYPQSEHAADANALVEMLQHRLVEQLESVVSASGAEGFVPIDWLRDQGKHGGGRRYAAANTALFNRASVNISSVHYDDLPDKRLRSATALSVIIHPDNPHAPSMHTHISWTELRDGTSYWRLMADLNPALESSEATQRFDAMLKSATGEYFEEGKAQGDRYFFIPDLQRHRGVSHYYLEGYSTDEFDADKQFARQFGESVIDCYIEILSRALDLNSTPTDEDYETQRAYHTVYLFQVLTLDRGTTSGLLVHDQNDTGILASLPSFIDRDLLASWKERMTAPQDKLLANIVAALPEETPCPVTDDIRQDIADKIRDHYRVYPEALSLQASGNVIPPTVQNHSDQQ